MLGLSSISDRIVELEQTVQRSSGKAHTLQLQTIPALPDAATIAGSSSSSSAASSAAAPPPAAASHSSILSKLSELSTAFQHILSQDPTVHQYMSRASAIESLVEAHSSSGSSSLQHLGLSSSSLLRAEEGVVLSASSSLEHSARMLTDLQSLLPILDQKWPLIDDFASLQSRVEKVHAALPRQAFEAAQTTVAFERFLTAYHALMEMLNRQFILWNQQLTLMESELDTKLAAKQRR